MILAVFAALLIAQPVETPPPEESAEAAAEAVSVAAERVEESAEQAAEAAADAAEAAAEAAEDAAEASDESGEQVCRRRSYDDDFGRRRTRKVCTPR